MQSFTWHRRLLPLTIAVLALLFMDKAVGLAREAATTDAPSLTPLAAAAPLAPPSSSKSTQLPVQAIGSVSANPATPAELELLRSLKARRSALDDREHKLNERDELLQSAEVKLQAKLDQLAQLQGRLEEMEQAREKRSSSNWTGLVKTYEDMKPRDASAIFNVLDMPVLLEVLDRMDERKAASVLAGMAPERAKLATQMLAMKRTHQEQIGMAATPIASR